MAASELGPRNVPQALRLLRSQAELSRDKAAELCGVEPRTLSRYESAKAHQRLDVTVLRRLVVCYAKHLEVDADALWADFGRLIDRYTTAARILDAQADVLRGDLPSKGGDT